MGETTVGHVAGEVVRALYGAGYMESTIGQYRKSIRALERYAGGPDAVYTRGLGAGFAASTFSERTGGFSRQRWFDYGRLARLCDSYLRSGSVDLGKWRRSRLAEPVVPGLAVVMERWEAYLAGSGLASATVGHYRRMAGLFLTWLESHGVVSLDGSDGSHVLGFLAGLRSRWSESSMRHAASDLRPLFRWLGRDRPGRHTQDPRDRGNVARRRAPPLAGGVRLAVGAVEGRGDHPAVADVRAEGMRCDRSEDRRRGLGFHEHRSGAAKDGQSVDRADDGTAGREAGVLAVGRKARHRR